MTDKYFLDTNILVYAHDSTDQRKSAIAQQVIFKGIRSESAVVSTQVLSEFFVTITKKIEKSIGIDEAKKEIELLRVMKVVEIEVEMITRAIDMHKNHQLSYWDSLIIVAALRAGCTQLYTEDLNPGQSFQNLTIVNPFTSG